MGCLHIFQSNSGHVLLRLSSNINQLIILYLRNFGESQRPLRPKGNDAYSRGRSENNCRRSRFFTYLDQFVNVFIDDILSILRCRQSMSIIFKQHHNLFKSISYTLNEVNVFLTFREHQLYAKLDKCIFGFMKLFFGPCYL